MGHGMAASVLLLKAEREMKPQEKWRESRGAQGGEREPNTSCSELLPVPTPHGHT